MFLSKAKIFKIESFGAVDGPGVRLVFFFQGCSYRCLYCHNPEGWQQSCSLTKKLSIRQMLKIYQNNKSFYINGGITVSGGDPLLQIDFLIKFAKVCKRKKIHLAICTACGNLHQDKSKYLKLLKYVDLWIIDVKAFNKQDHQFITKNDELNEKEFVQILEEHKKPYWISYVLVDKLTNHHSQLEELGRFIGGLKYLEKFLLLSYHNMAISKYNNLKINYPLASTPVLDSSQKQQALEIIRKFSKNDKIWSSDSKT